MREILRSENELQHVAGILGGRWQCTTRGGQGLELRTARIEEEREATCVVGELHGVDDVDVHPEGLQRERRALVPDVPTVAQHSILDRTSRPQHADVPSPHDL